MRWPRRRAAHTEEQERLFYEIVAERLHLYACGARAGSAMVRAEMAKDDGDRTEQLAWELQAVLAAEDAAAHGRRALAAANRLKAL